MREPICDSVGGMPQSRFVPAVRLFLGVSALLIAALIAGPAWGQAASVMEAPPLNGPIPPLDEFCSDGVVRDDGTFETGYGWIPSVIEGIYVQAFDLSEFAQPSMERVCICFSRTRDDSSITFDVVFYLDDDGQPEEFPFASYTTLLEDVPEGLVGKFAEVPTPGVQLPTTGTIYIGARWDASVDQFFFVCDDTTETTERVNAWFKDDRAEDWDNVFETPDSIFNRHRSFLIRPVGSLAPLTDIPTLDGVGIGVLAALLLVAGILRFRSQS